jgi:hypothetical protein
MQHIFIALSIVIFFTGCGLMGTSKEENEEPKQIHVPQKINVEIPTILKKDTNNNQTKKTNYTNWYN